MIRPWEGGTWPIGSAEPLRNGFRLWSFCEVNIMEVQRDFKELLALLNEHEVEYVIVGGYALAFHGDVPVDYLGRQQFIANKRATGRKRDLADLEALGED
jgi:hypothetical protein